jgi:hypothetical protein
VQRHFFAPLFAFTSASLLIAACTADLEEGCVSGKCSPEGLPTSSSGGDQGGDGGPTCMPGPTTGDVPCDVFEVIHRECHRCHTDPLVMGAPFPLLTYEDIQEPFNDKIRRFQRMNQVIRPNGVPRMPLGGMLNDQDLKILGDWLTMCAPPVTEGTGCECTTPNTGMGCITLP